MAEAVSKATVVDSEGRDTGICPKDFGSVIAVLLACRT